MPKSYKAIIVDDEPMAREILATHLSKIDFIEVVASCKNATEAFSVVSINEIDLAFLDINMPQITGLMFAKAIKDQTAIIFTTAYRDHAVDGFELEAIDYLLKPISLERLLKSVNKFMLTKRATTQEISADFTFFRSDRKMTKVNFEALMYVESFGDYSKIHTTDGTLVTRETMQHIIEKLPESTFLRTHRSFIVNMTHIDSFTTEHITIQRAAIPISRSYKEAVSQRLNAF